MEDLGAVPFAEVDTYLRGAQSSSSGTGLEASPASFSITALGAMNS